MHGNGAAGLQAELHGFHGDGMAGDRDLRIQRHVAIAQRLEGEVKRHQLGQAGGVAWNIRTGSGDHLTAGGVYNNAAGAGRGRAEAGGGISLHLGGRRRTQHRVEYVADIVIRAGLSRGRDSPRG
jgi:hypothetical protein